MANVQVYRRELSELKKKKEKLRNELEKLKDQVSRKYYFSKRAYELDKKKILDLTKDFFSVRKKISEVEGILSREKFRKTSLNKLLKSKKIKKYLVSNKTLELARRTSFYYAFKKGYLFNPYTAETKLVNNYKNFIRTFLMGRFLSKLSGILDIERKNPILNRIKNSIDRTSVDKIISGKSLVGFTIEKFVDKSFEKWFPGKFGNTPRLIKAWITRKMIYGESGFSKQGLRKLSYGGFTRKRGLGATFSSTSYLSRRRSIRSVRRGFRKGGGYRRFA
ncbi:MAG: hypothetical protein KatS3mg068_1582 [Candidatus Sericytochromatia bacterium]|nr:MAG: hypothetical protein KatS3mg068_1582 [Candidatus Sericytochromatia bacterium]